MYEIEIPRNKLRNQAAMMYLSHYSEWRARGVLPVANVWGHIMMNLGFVGTALCSYSGPRSVHTTRLFCKRNLLLHWVYVSHITLHGTARCHYIELEEINRLGPYITTNDTIARCNIILNKHGIHLVLTDAD